MKSQNLEKFAEAWSHEPMLIRQVNKGMLAKEYGLNDEEITKVLAVSKQTADLGSKELEERATKGTVIW